MLLVKKSSDPLDLSYSQKRMYSSVFLSEMEDLQRVQQAEVSLAPISGLVVSESRTEDGRLSKKKASVEKLVVQKQKVFSEKPVSKPKKSSESRKSNAQETAEKLSTVLSAVKYVSD
jgi:hypothetical protein